MPYDGSGNFNRTFPPDGWQGDATANIKIRADRHDQHDSDLAQGLSNAICRDGQSQIAANIPWNGFRITGLGAPVDANDAVTKGYSDSLKNFSTGLTLPGADLNGRLVFSAPTGVNGISWTGADLFWGAKLAVANQSPNRLVLNDAATATGTDYLTIDEIGVIGAPSQISMTANLNRVGANWRTPVAGQGSVFQMANGVARFYTNVTVTTDPYGIAAMHEYLTADGNSGHAFLYLNKTASTKVVDIVGRMGGKHRWLMRLGDEAAEAGANVGSNFALYAYDDAASVASQAMSIDRATRLATFYGSTTVNGTLTTGGVVVNYSGIFTSNGASTVLSTASAGNIHLRPNGAGDATGEFRVDNSGNAFVSGATYGGTGYMCRSGMAGSYSSNRFNFWWTGQLRAYVDGTDLGNILNTCDYRIKKDVEPLDSTWNRVKALRPVSYTYADFTLGETQLSKADDVERWGFLAHELQEWLLPTAADGEKDAPNAIQSVNTVAVIAALTKALQEAMARIEVLEGKA